MKKWTATEREKTMQKTQRTFTREFKVEAVQLAKTSDKPLAQIACDLGIADSTLHHWCKLFSEHGEQAFPGSGHQMPQEEELRRLKRENELLRQERDILKKLSASFRAAKCNLPIHCRALPGVPDPLALSGIGCLGEWLLCLETPRGVPACTRRCQARRYYSADLPGADALVYGSPRIHAILKARGVHTSRKRVARLMHELGISAAVKRTRKPTTSSDPQARFVPNTLKRDFAAELPNVKWGTDTKAVETARSVVVRGGHGGCVFAPGRRLGDGGHGRRRVGRTGVAYGGGQAAPTGGTLASLGSGNGVHQRSLSSGLAGTGDRSQRESAWQLLGECGDGVLFRLAGERMYQPAALSDPTRGAFCRL